MMSDPEIGGASFQDGPLHVLLIDDDPQGADRLATTLEEGDLVDVQLHWEDTLAAGLNVLTGEEGRHPDVVALDVGIAGADGTDAVEACIENAPSAGVVALATSEGRAAGRAAVEAGAAEFLVKEDVTPQLLARTLRWATERARLTERIRQQEAARLATAENILGGIFRSAPDEGLIFATPSVAEMFGYDGVDAILEVDPSDLYADPEVRQQLRTTLAEEGAVGATQVECRRRDGTTFPGLLRGTAVRSVDGQVWYYEWAVTDITDRKRVEEVLQEERNRFATLFQNLPTPVVHGRADTEGQLRIQGVNESFETVFGISQSAAEGENIQDLIVPTEDAEEAESLRRHLLSGQPIDGTVRRETTDGPRHFRIQVALRAGADEPDEGYAIYTDITERKRREEQLVRMRERTDHALEHTDAVIYEIDLQTGSVRWQGNVEQFFGLAPEEISTGEEFRHRVVHPEDCADLGRLYDELATGERDSGTLEYRTHPERGSPRWIRDSVSVEENGRRRAIGLAQNVTAQKKRERRHEAIFNRTFQFTGLMDPDGTVIEVNDTASDFGGGDREEVVGKPLWETYWAQTGDAALQTLKDAIRRAAEGEFVRYEREIQGDEKNRIVDFSIRPVADEDGNVTLLIPEARDITERKEQEQLLKDRQEKIQALYEATDQLLRSGSEEEVGASILTLVNKVFGYPIVVVRLVENGKLVPTQVSPEIPEHMPERPSFDVGGESVVAEVFETGTTAVFDDLRRVDDPHDYGEVRATTIVPLGRHGTLSVADLDVGTIAEYDRRLIEILSTYATLVLDQIDRERDLREAKEGAEEAAQLKSAMLANMSHELRTPLTAIIGFSELLTEELEGRPAKRARDIYRSGKRLMDTFDSVLLLSRIESGGYSLDYEPVQLNVIIREVAQEVQLRARENGIAVEVEGAEQAVEVTLDEDATRRIVTNLVENAIKFTPEGGRVSVRTRLDDEAARIEVEDTGIGIDEDAQSKIFQAFKQESEGFGREYEGSGLGLSIVRRLASHMNGTIEVNSEKGAGTRFAVRFPV